jgi:hypothetical protein
MLKSATLERSSMRLIGLALLLPACTWVSGKQFDARLPEMDDDGDGVSEVDGDCDDENPEISPAVPEVYYDGVDSDCGADDDYDQDGDGHVPAEYAGQKTAGVDGSGALPAGDCADLDPDVNPAVVDTIYSGVDEDCDGADDYDQDADGFVEDDNAGRATEYADGTGMLPSGDCDDEVSNVYPDATDTPYDGIDADCGGEDDYDLDLDGWVKLGVEYGPTQYVEGSGVLELGDCDDADASIHPDAQDQWYDGTDSDCLGNSDYDQDGDGFLSPTDPGGDDCDDLDPDAYPGGPETLGDRVDGDCNGEDDGFVLAAFERYAWTDAHDPVFSANNTDVFLSIVGTQVHDGETRYYDMAAAVQWAVDDVELGPIALVRWSGGTTSDPGTYSIAEGQAFQAADDYLYGVVQYDFDSSRGLILQRYRLDDGSRDPYVSQSTTDSALFEDISLEVSDGVMYVVGCESTDGVLTYVKVSDIASDIADETQETAGIAARACAIDEYDGGWHVYTSESSGLVDYTFDTTIEDPVFTGSLLTSAYLPLDVDVYDQYSDREIVLADAVTGGIVHIDEVLDETRIAAGDGVVDVAMKEDVDGTKYFAWVDTDGAAWLSYGTPERGFDTVQLEAGFAAEEAAVWSTGDYVMVAITGGDEVAVGVAAR